MKTRKCFFRACIICIPFLLLFLTPHLSAAATFCVSDATELQTALTTAQSNGEDDTIQIVQGTYSGNFVYAFSEANNLTLEGGYTSACASREVNPANTVLDGGANERVLALSCPDHAPEFVVSGVTLRNGDTSNDGAGLFAMTDHGELTVSNNTIADNSAGNGGGVYASGFAAVTLTSNIISGNSAHDGGGVCAESNGIVTLTSNTIRGNSLRGVAGYAGNVSARDNNTVALTSNTISENAGGWAIGGVYAGWNQTVTLSNNTITGNSALHYGGVVVYYNNTATLTNNTVTGNSSGGVHSDSNRNVTLTNNTITGNSSGHEGGGVFLEIEYNSDTAHIYNNIIYQNTAESEGNDVYINNDENGDFICSTFSLYNNDFDQSASGTYISCPYTIDSSNLNNVDPLFVGSSNYRLSSSSPCINAGNNSAPSIPTTDEDGNPRISGGTVDMGAYEYNPSAPIANAGSDQTVAQGTTVTLDGSASSDPGSETITYLWTQIRGTLVTLSDPTAVQPTFAAEGAFTSVGSSPIFRLTVTNTSGLKNTDSVCINVNVGTPVADFNADGKSDILWRNNSSGEVYIWLMNGTNIGSQGSPGTVSDLNWGIEYVGDFNGDGKADILWRHNSTGEMSIWVMNGITRTSSGTPGWVTTDWQVKEVGDFNGDGKADILWRNDTSGEVYVWLMDGTSIGTGGSSGTVSDLNWEINGVGDFNGDGKADILWRHVSTGEMSIWIMDGITRASGGTPGWVTTDWQIRGLGDFNGDGKADLLWRNDSSGEVYTWLMNGTNIGSDGSSGTVADLNWQIQKVGDYTGDGKADILWRHSSTGEMSIWVMDGITRVSGGTPGWVTIDWQIE